MSTEQFDIEKYIEMLTSNFQNSDIFFEYIKELKAKLYDEKIYTTSFYISVSLNDNDNITEVEKAINKLEKIGCSVKKLEDEGIKKLLYKTINKMGGGVP